MPSDRAPGSQVFYTDLLTLSLNDLLPRSLADPHITLLDSQLPAVHQSARIDTTLISEQFKGLQKPPPLIPCLLALPVELQILIASHLHYPDLLSLKITHPALRRLFHPTVYDRISWLLSRAALHLPIPSYVACDFKTDRDLVANEEVTAIIRRRRQHFECAESTYMVGSIESCLLDNGKTCDGAFQRMTKRTEKQRTDSRSKLTRLLSNVKWLRGDALVFWTGLALVLVLPLLAAWMLRN